MMRTIIHCVCVVFLIVASAMNGARADDDDWSAQVTPYLWLGGSNVEAALPGAGSTVEFGLDLFDLIEGVEIGGMVAGEVRRGRFSTIADAAYGSFSFEGAGVNPSFDGLQLGFAAWFGNAYLGYQMVDSPRAQLDVIAGVRILAPVLSIRPDGAPAAAEMALVDETFADPVLGVRGAFQITDRLQFQAIGDGGGFGAGSDVTWQAYGGATYAFSDFLAVEAGYRYVRWNLDAADTDILRNVVAKGPIVGVSFRF